MGGVWTVRAGARGRGGVRVAGFCYIAHVCVGIRALARGTGGAVDGVEEIDCFASCVGGTHAHGGGGAVFVPRGGLGFGFAADDGFEPGDAKAVEDGDPVFEGGLGDEMLDCPQRIQAKGLIVGVCVFTQ